MEMNSCVHIDEVLLNVSDITLRFEFQIIAGVLYSITIAFGLISNVFVITALIKYRNLLPNFSNSFIGNLAVADIIICAMSVPVTAYVDFNKVWPLGVIACRIVPFIQGLCALVSSMTLSAIAIDRYFRIVKREPIDRTTSITIVLIIWIISCVTCVPLAINSDLSDGAQFHDPPLCGLFCTEYEWRNAAYRKMYGTFLFLIQYVVPCVVIAVAYGIIARHFNAVSVFYKRVSISSTNPQYRRSIDRRRRTNRLLVAMIVVFAVSSAPLALINIVNDYGALPAFLEHQRYFVTAIGHLSSALSTIIDPVLYVIMNRKFQDTVLHTIKCRTQEKMQKLSSPRYSLVIHFHSPTVHPNLMRRMVAENMLRCLVRRQK